jgi:hypothetical protein
MRVPGVFVYGLKRFGQHEPGGTTAVSSQISRCATGIGRDARLKKMGTGQRSSLHLATLFAKLLTRVKVPRELCFYPRQSRFGEK